MSGLSAEGTVFTIRVPKTISEEIRAIAVKEFERPSTVVRRLLRRGLTVENQHSTRDSDKAA